MDDSQANFIPTSNLVRVLQVQVKHDLGWPADDHHFVIPSLISGPTGHVHVMLEAMDRVRTRGPSHSLVKVVRPDDDMSWTSLDPFSVGPSERWDVFFFFSLLLHSFAGL
jgi:hypothetical protein